MNDLKKAFEKYYLKKNKKFNITMSDLKYLCGDKGYQEDEIRWLRRKYKKLYIKMGRDVRNEKLKQLLRRTY